ncbi:putative phosphoglycerate mutase [Herbihabitans rhizosphaerae]|uniref:Putative phosphoglycerate mutase n=1 Tax=Herbihabitans rhizosphaerae TaxID=1872711 RepID=A0A4V2EUN7_9PSEU|nr:histidine phosphatase family protein [Herbihabitans rhizosphaerae]RZS45213.1 putative phosphoglycerate mutase [Herbihabitans rhizosphaerae]
MSGTRLMLVRHGETESNLRRALDSAPPGPPLTPEGRRQADALADRLAADPVVAIYASTATRAQQTAEPVAKAHGLPVEIIDGVHEVFVGDLEGRTDSEARDEFYDVFKAWAAGDLERSMPGGESAARIRERYLTAIDQILERHPGGHVVVVSHGGVIRLVAQWLAGNVDHKLASVALLPNTGHVLLESAESGWRCLEWTGVEL